MGLFRRRDKTNHHPTNGEHYADAYTNSKRTFAMQRTNSTTAHDASIPDIPLPKAPDPQVNPVAYLRSIYAVRERSKLVLEKAKRNQLRHFNVDMSKFSDTAAYVVAIIKVCLRGTGYNLT